MWMTWIAIENIASKTFYRTPRYRVKDEAGPRTVNSTLFLKKTFNPTVKTAIVDTVTHSRHQPDLYLGHHWCSFWFLSCRSWMSREKVSISSPSCRLLLYCPFDLCSRDGREWLVLDRAWCMSKSQSVYLEVMSLTLRSLELLTLSWRLPGEGNEAEFRDRGSASRISPLFGFIYLQRVSTVDNVNTYRPTDLDTLYRKNRVLMPRRSFPSCEFHTPIHPSFFFFSSSPSFVFSLKSF